MNSSFDVRLEQLVTNCVALDTIAQGWRAAGATSFGVWRGNEPLWGIPAGQNLPGDLSAPIQPHGNSVAELRVSGVRDDLSVRHLTSQAALITRILETEDDLDAMTEELVQAQDQLLALYDLTRATHRHIELESLINSISAAAARLIKSEGAVCWVMPALEQLVMAQHPRIFLTPEQMQRLAEHALAVSQPVLNNFDTGEANAPTDLSFTRTRHLILIPIEVRGTLGAGLALFNKSHGVFTAADLKLANTIAELASAQIDNALLYQETLARTKLEHELGLAARIQSGILPRTLPHLAGLEIYGTARSASLVGGDFFDHITRGTDELGIVVGDVAGKGVSAALLMSMMLTTIRSAMRFMPMPLPGGVLHRVDQDLYNELAQLGTFVTIFIGWYDARQHLLKYANAGHAPVIYVPANGKPELLIADGTAMGVIEHEQWQNHVLNFGAGDVLIAATDGFPEARINEDEMVGYERLLQLAQQLASRPAREIGEGFYRAVSEWTHGHAQDDDQTIIVIKGVA